MQHAGSMVANVYANLEQRDARVTPVICSTFLCLWTAASVRGFTLDLPKISSENYTDSCGLVNAICNILGRICLLITSLAKDSMIGSADEEKLELEFRLVVCLL
jgi:hypothetical protein